ncbi:MAG: DUF1549 and DUF1553 domain-containing protein [Fuerstiella sp.]|nr:DUF1549 and DUF1553 domain-containing protein [Fuerstiella sp.]
MNLRYAIPAGLPVLSWQVLLLMAVPLATADEHWAFQPPVSPELPVIVNEKWYRNPIDRFVVARLQDEGLEPSPRADRAVLLRRLCLDLTGLPPMKEEIDAFMADSEPDAWERLVERLLKSPHYGERWAVWWLDGARYADTNGYEVDRPRMIWAWRDWVIRSLNNDMPFDQFTMEQMAGDLLPNATTQQRIATGFHRNTFMNEEGAHDWEQFRYESIVDRVHTTATVFMGLTLACAQCHDHKYDPFTQEEYFQFFALLNNADEPELEVPVEDLLARQAEIDAQIAVMEADRPQHFPLDSELQNANVAVTDSAQKQRQEHLQQRVLEWIEHESATAVRWQLLDPRQAVSANNATMTVLEDGSLLVTGDRPELDTYEIVCDTDLPQITGFRLEAIPDPRLPNHGPGRGSVMSDGTFVVTEFDVDAQPLVVSQQGDSATEIRSLNFVRADATYQNERRTVDKAIDGNRLTSWHTNNAARRRHVAVFQVDEPYLAEGRTKLTITVLQNFVHQQTLGRFRLFVTDDEQTLSANLRDPVIDSILRADPAKRSRQQIEQLKKHYLSVAEELTEYNRTIEELRETRPQLPTTMVLSERAVPRRTRLHERGDYRRPATEVAAGVPDVLHPLRAGETPSRLALANWIVDRRNPLTARVIVNQIWQQYFGRGLVSTPEDFGSQGALPSHPELLDWLAVEFMERNWSLKELHRLIVNSATWQQSSRTTVQQQNRDPENILLDRGPRHRVNAEMVRDILLAASGLLNRRIGGPSVFPAQPNGALAGFSGFRWSTSEGGDQYRRSLYTFRQRASPYAMSSLFDAPPGLTCTVRRRRSTTPLQSLALLNDSLTIEASRALAEKILGERRTSQDEKLILAFERCTSRSPDSHELQTIRDFYQQQKSHLTDRSDVTAALTAGEQTVDSVAPAEFAAWIVTVRLLLNLHEVIVKQ